MLSFAQYQNYLLEETKAQAVTKSQLKDLENYLDNVFGSLGIDIAFTKHFFERLNDARNKLQITVQEVSDIFSKAYKEYGTILKSAKAGWQAVLRDALSNLNIPFVLQWNGRSKELELVAKTIMRKKNFQSSNEFLTVR